MDDHLDGGEERGGLAGAEGVGGGGGLPGGQAGTPTAGRMPRQRPAHSGAVCVCVVRGRWWWWWWWWGGGGGGATKRHSRVSLHCSRYEEDHEMKEPMKEGGTERGERKREVEGRA